MVSDSVRRLVLVVVVMIFASNGLRVSIDAAIDVQLAQQQRLQLQRTMLVLNYRQKACEICSAVLLRMWRVHMLRVLHVLWATCLCIKRAVLLQVREVTRDLINVRLLYAIHVCVAQERAQ